MNIVDSSGWIEYFFSRPNATFFSPPIEDTENLLVPVICLYEVFKKVNSVADEAKALQIIAQMKQGRVMDLTEDIALKASLVSLKRKLPMADSLILSTAIAHGALLWTQDEHFKHLPNVSFREARTKPSRARREARRR
jgi:predicted nucleic acid-binding protein